MGCGGWRLAMLQPSHTVLMPTKMSEANTGGMAASRAQACTNATLQMLKPKRCPAALSAALCWPRPQSLRQVSCIAACHALPVLTSAQDNAVQEVYSCMQRQNPCKATPAAANHTLKGVTHPSRHANLKITPYVCRVLLWMKGINAGNWVGMPAAA